MKNILFLYKNRRLTTIFAKNIVAPLATYLSPQGNILLAVPFQGFIEMLFLKIRPIVIYDIEVRVNGLHR